MATVALSNLPSIKPSTLLPTEPIGRLSVDHYHAMIQAGILTDDDPIELLEGWLVVKMSKNPPHRVVTRLIRQALERLAQSIKTSFFTVQLLQRHIALVLNKRSNNSPQFLL